MIAHDTRKVRPGSVFYAIPSASNPHEEVLTLADRCLQAQAAGAHEIVAEIAKPAGLTVKFRQVPDVRRALAEAASLQAGEPSRKMFCVGITGTSGKTTTAFLVESVLRTAGHTVGLIGTVLCRYPGFELESTHTTPGPIELQELLAQMLSAGCTAVVMEVSSHAIKQRRVDAVYFDCVAFTNLSPEHLDYHPDMEDYFDSKARLFDALVVDSRLKGGKAPRAVICVEDEWAARLAQQWRKQHGEQTLLEVRGPELSAEITARGISGTWRGARLESRLTGAFNVSNIAVALGVGEGAGLTPQQATAGISSLAGVPGRMERVSQPTCPFTVLVDYAHKPDALEKVLLSVRSATPRLTVVFGCGGDRDRLKRPVMGRIAAHLADQVILTSDNPRTEDPNRILQEVYSGVQDVSGGTEKTLLLPDRAVAIQTAVEGAVAGEIVIIAGKGHETYQIVGQAKVSFDDCEVARAALRSRGYS